jgi:hypothetical protein
MKFSASVAILACLGVPLSAAADVVVIPIANTTVPAGASLNSLIRETPRVYQGVIAASELTALQGSAITGLTYRIRATSTGTTWPSVNADFAQYEIELSTSNNPPGLLSTTFASNVGADAVLVRSGPLTIPALSFPGGNLEPVPNDFGYVIPFATPFVYGGGDLLIHIRLSGHNEGTTRFLDAVSTSGPGYGSLVQALRYDHDFFATTGFQTNFTVVQLTWEPGGICYADCTGDELLTIDDFICFINEFAQAQSLPPQQQITHYANCTGSTSEPVLTIDDFICFIDQFAQGCP